MPHSQLSTDLDPESSAFFLDCDGTLSAIVAHPASACVEPWLRDRVGQIAERCGGALALVSGRSIEQLDVMFAPLRLPCAGVHGIERRGADGEISRMATGTEQLESVARRFADFTQTAPELIVEPKPGSVALHYRMRPEMEQDVLQLAAEQVARDPALHIIRGKMVVEVSAGDRTKGDAIEDFMREPPFAGRRPVFAGDDTTDEDGFTVVNAMGGLSIKIGPGETAATVRVPAMEDLHGWMDDLCTQWSSLPLRQTGEADRWRPARREIPE